MHHFLKSQDPDCSLACFRSPQITKSCSFHQKIMKSSTLIKSSGFNKAIIMTSGGPHAGKGPVSPSILDKGLVLQLQLHNVDLKNRKWSI